MEPRSSWEAASFAVTREFANILCNTKFHCCVHKRLPSVPILSQINLVRTTTSYLSKTHFDVIFSRLGFLSELIPFGFPTKILYAFFSPCVLNALPDLSSLTSSFYLYLAKSTSYEAPQYADFSNLLTLHPVSVQIFSSTPCSQSPSVYVPPLMSKTKFHIHTKLLISSWIKFNLLLSSSNIWTVSHFQKIY
jgi:hypothetical protein